MPFEDDYAGVVTALNRLKDTYQLEIKDIINGNISEKFRSKKLNGKKLNKNFFTNSYGVYFNK
jgi:hypothetical protein